MAGVWLYDSKARAAALSEGRHRRCDRYAGFSRDRAAQPRNRARERMADISPEERCHYASVYDGFIGQTAIWPAPGMFTKIRLPLVSSANDSG